MIEADQKKRGGNNASSGIPLDAVVGMVVLLISAVFLNNLLETEGTGAYVKTTTLPTLLIIALMCLATLLLLLGLANKGRVTRNEPSNSIGRAGIFRVAGIVVWIGGYIAALPWLGYSVATALFLIGACLLYGNRNPLVIISIAIAIPLLLLLFFEKFMIVLLPTSKLFG